MTIRFACPDCGRQFQLPDDAAGKRQNCPDCGRSIDVPVIGSATIPVMLETGTTALAIDAGRTLLLDREEMVEAANQGKIAILGCKPMEGSTEREDGSAR